MKINVAQQLKEPVGSVRDVTIDEAVDAGFPVRGTVRLLRTNRSILVNGRLDTTAREVCSRCLDEFDNPLTLDIEEEYFITKDPVSGTPLALPAEAGTFTIDENNVLDLGEAIRQYTLLMKPMKPICRKNCAGLCPQCGRNLNDQQCNCTPADNDPAWAPLKGLLKDKKQKSNIERG